MAKRKEIKFQNVHGALRGRQNGMGLKYTDLLELEVLAHSLSDMGHNILLGYEREEGWPSGT